MTSPGTGDAAPATPATEPATSGTSVPQDAPAVDNGPDNVGGSSVHVPGQAPGVSILSGPASMQIGSSKSKSSTTTRRKRS